MTLYERVEVLNRVLERCKGAPFYRDRVPGQPLTSIDELKQIPLTTKEDLRHASPFGVICVPRNELYQYHETFGTTGTPVSTWLTKEDLKDNAREITQCGVSFSKYDTVLVRFPYAISAVAHMVHAAAQLKRACVIPVSARSTVSPFPRVIDMLRRLEVTVLACLPLQALLIAETVEMLGYKPSLDFPKLRAICTAGEPLTTGRRKLLESIWGVPVFDFYGMAEIGTAVVDCEFRRTHPLEDYFIIEILDDDFKEEVKPGEPGNLVVTTLRKRANPVIRYITGDRARKIPEDCLCGKDFCLEVRGRKEDSINVNGRFFDLWDLEDIVSHLPARRFWVAGPTSHGLQFVVEEEKKGDSVSSDIIQKLEKKYNINLAIEIVPNGTLYDRSELLEVGVIGKPRYIYSNTEMKEKAYLKSVKI